MPTKMEVFQELASRGVGPEKIPDEDNRALYQEALSRGLIKLNGATAPAQDAPKNTAPETKGFDAEKAKAEAHQIISNMGSDGFLDPQGRDSRLITKNLGSGFGEAAALPGLALDAVNWGLKKVGLPNAGDHPLGYDSYAQAVKAGWEHLLAPIEKNRPAFTPDSIKPENDHEKLVSKMAEYTGANLLPVAGSAGAATGLMGKAALIRDAASGPLAGVGAHYGAESGDDLSKKLGISKEHGQQLGEMLGGLLGSTLPYDTEAILASGKHGYDSVKKYAANKAEQATRSSLGKKPDQISAVAQNLEDAANISDKIKGLKPDVAAASNVPTAESIRNGLLISNTDAHAAAVTNYNNAKQAIDDHIKTLWPDQPPSSILGTARAKMASVVSKLDDRMAKLGQASQGLAEKMGRGDTNEVGDKLVALRNAMNDTAKDVKNGLYKGVSKLADSTGTKFDAAPIRSAVKEIVADSAADITPSSRRSFDKFLGEAPKASATTVLGPDGKPALISTPKDEINFDTFQDLWQAVNRELGRGGAKAYNVTQLKQVLQDNLKTAPPQVQEAFAGANKWYQEHYQPVFKEGLGAAMVKENALGRVSPEQKIVRSMVLNKGKQGVEDFNRVFTNPVTGQVEPEALKTLSDGVWDDLAAARPFDTQGNIDPRKVFNWMNKNKSALDELPDIRKGIENLSDIQTNLNKRMAETISSKKTVENGLLTKYLGANADKVVAKAMGSEDAADLVKLHALITRTGGDQAGKAFSSAVARKIVGMKNPSAYLDANRTKLEPVLNKLDPSLLSDLDVIFKAKAIVERMKPPATVLPTGIGDSVVKEHTGMSVPTLFSVFKAVKAGQISPAYAAVHIFARSSSKMSQTFTKHLLEDSLGSTELRKVAKDMLVQAAAGVAPKPPLTAQLGNMSSAIASDAWSNAKHSLGVMTKGEPREMAMAMRIYLPYFEQLALQAEEESKKPEDGKNMVE